MADKSKPRIKPFRKGTLRELVSESKALREKAHELLRRSQELDKKIIDTHDRRGEQERKDRQLSATAARQSEVGRDQV